MSSITSPIKVVGAQSQLDLSEETRLAQLKRIEELKGQIGDLPSWFGQKQSSLQHSVYPNPAYQSASSTPDRQFSPYRIPGPSLVNDKPYETTEKYPLMNLPDQTGLYEAANRDMYNWYNDDNSTAPFDGMQMDHPQHHSVSDAGSHSMDISDETPVSHRMGSTPSKISALSSNTSADISDMLDPRAEAYYTIGLEKVQHRLSSTTSTSSQLSSAKPTTPAVVETLTDEMSIDPPLAQHPSISQPSSQADLVDHSSGYNQPATQTLLNQERPTKRRRVSSKLEKLHFSALRPRTTIPSTISREQLGRQGVEAAMAARLNPYALHSGEYQLLRNDICHVHVTTYLNIRNRILRLWTQNPVSGVTPEEAAGCSYSSRWLGLAEIAYEWLIRNGYINFGCVDVPYHTHAKNKANKAKRARKTIVVVGAGMSGLGCARQLEGLFNHYRDKWTSNGEEPPQVIVLEGRSRIGGRIHSHRLQNQNSNYLPSRQSQCSAEMGAHIIIGFNHGNPLNMIIRGQLALEYHTLKDAPSFYDFDGGIVDEDRDKKIQKLYNEILDRASVYKHKPTIPSVIEGDQSMIDDGRDPTGDVGKTIGMVEEEKRLRAQKAAVLTGDTIMPSPTRSNKGNKKSIIAAGSRNKAIPARITHNPNAMSVPNVLGNKHLNFGQVVAASQFPTLGDAMDEGIRQSQDMLGLSAQDLRLLNWHIANLEYANAANLSKLSLSGWDQDNGYEFEGAHAQIKGGYQQVPHGIFRYPSKLDLRTRKAVKQISYDPNGGSEGRGKVVCEDGEVIDADQIVLTAPLGVLKSNAITFEPELPPWKLQSIDQLGFGTLNKIVLVYERAFWDVDQDMIFLLRDTENKESLDQADYSRNRGCFFLFWNCIKTSGRPVLIALMSGDAAHEAEALTDRQITLDVTDHLRKIYKHEEVPLPSETIVTRWGTDRFARGSYSSVGPAGHSDDYDAMGRAIGNLHFAGEATCGSYPATVHGAYISGLRAASELLEDLIGPITIQQPLVPPLHKADGNVPAIKVEDHPMDATTAAESAAAKAVRLDSFEFEILSVIYAKLGRRPEKPVKAGSNPFLLYQSEKMDEVKAQLEAQRQAAGANPNAKISMNDVRTVLGKMWREASEAVKQPYIEQTSINRQAYTENMATFPNRLAAWDVIAVRLRKEYVESHPGVLSKEEEKSMWEALGDYGGAQGHANRRAKKNSGYADESDSPGDAA
jgi:lysine-specific histone demethylase 1